MLLHVPLFLFLYNEFNTNINETKYQHKASNYNNILLSNNYSAITKSDIQCPDNCYYCNETSQICEVCYRGFGLEIENGVNTGKCSKCFDHCDYCTFDHTNCTGCKVLYGFEIVNGVNTRKCNICPDNCINCGKNNKICEECKEYYGVDIENDTNAGKCVECQDKYCKKCSKNSKFCTECKDGYDIEIINGVKTGKCIKCPDGCRKCNNEYCTSCQMYYGRERNNTIYTGKCLRCPDNCTFCYDNYKICKKCDFHFALEKENGTNPVNCIKCPDNCNSCENGTFCKHCNYGFGLVIENGVNTGQCMKCLDNCLFCYENYKNCTYCENGYEIDFEKGLCIRKEIRCPEGCNECSSDIKTCHKCNDGYGFEIENGLKTGSCKKCLNNCSKCDDDYTICIANIEKECLVDGCIECIPGNSSLCKKCNSKLELNQEYKSVKQINILPTPTPKPFRVHINYDNANYFQYEHNFDEDIDIDDTEQIILDLTKNQTIHKEFSEIVIINNKNKNIAIEIPDGYSELAFRIKSNSYQKYDIIPLADEIIIKTEPSSIVSICQGRGTVVIESLFGNKIKLNVVQPFSKSFRMIPISDISIDLIEFTEQYSSIFIQSENTSEIEVKSIKLQKGVKGIIQANENVNLTEKLIFEQSSNLEINEFMMFNGCILDYPNLQMLENNSFITGNGINGIPSKIIITNRQNAKTPESTNLLLVESTGEFELCEKWGLMIDNDEFNGFKCIKEYNYIRLYTKKKEIKSAKTKDKSNVTLIVLLTISIIIFIGIVIFLIVYFIIIKRKSDNISDKESKSDSKSESESESESEIKFGKIKVSL